MPVNNYLVTASVINKGLARTSIHVYEWLHMPVNNYLVTDLVINKR